jgi:hypothetical protein
MCSNLMDVICDTNCKLPPDLAVLLTGSGANYV